LLDQKSNKKIKATKKFFDFLDLIFAVALNFTSLEFPTSQGSIEILK